MTTNISLLDKEKCVVAVLETILPTQEMYVDAFTELGFKSIQPFSDLNLFINKIQLEHFDWCILSLEHMSKINLIEFINNIYKVSNNKSVLISFIHKKDEKESLLLSIFENGCFSIFNKPDSVDEFEEKITNLINLVELYKGNYTFVSAEFIRSILKLNKFYVSLLQLEKSLLNVFPGSSRCLLNLAEAQCLNNNFDHANKTIAQAEFLDPEITKTSTELKKKYFDINNSNLTSSNNVLGIQNCVVIDPDTDVQYYVGETLKKLGVIDFQNLSDGEAAIQYLSQNPEPNLIILEWKVPTISGIALVQRIRKLGYHQCFLVVISSLVKVSEYPLLQEIGVDVVIEKPFDGVKLSKELIGVVQRSRKPLEQRAMERKIRIALSKHQINVAEEILTDYLKHSTPLKADKLQMQAEIEYEIGNYASANNFALNALKLSGGSVLLFSLLGKCFLKLNDFKNASHCFERAHALSPTNVDRILILVDLKQEEGKVSEASALMETAKKVDATRPDVVEMECRIALKNNDTETAMKALRTLNSLTGVVGMINNDAVAKIRAGKFEEGVNLYKQALQCLPLDSNEMREFITYNLALAYARKDDLDKSLEILKSIKVSSNAKIYPKFNSLKNKVRHSKIRGKKLELEFHNEKESKSLATASDINTHALEKIEQELEVKKASRCCYKIYTRVEKGEF